MLKLELDWAGDEAPETGVVSNEGDDVIVVVAYDETPGPSGWPVVRVYAQREQGVYAYREAMELDAWLATRYGVDDEDERQSLLDLARDV